MSAPRHLTFCGVPIEWDDPEAQLVVCDLRSLNEMSSELESQAKRIAELEAALRRLTLPVDDSPPDSTLAKRVAPNWVQRYAHEALKETPRE